MEAPSPDRTKVAAARRAAELLESGMLVGLGTGSTATLFVRAVGERVRAGLRVTGVPTSEGIARLAAEEGIALTTLEEHPSIDVDVDGADAADPNLDLLKGLGGALLREKIVAAASARFVVIMGEDKLVDDLSHSPLVPVETVRFGWSRTRKALEVLGASASLRMRRDVADQPFVTDGGNYLLDCRFEDLRDAPRVAARIKEITGVVEHGLFIGMATEAIVGQPDGSTRMIVRPSR